MILNQRANSNAVLAATNGTLTVGELTEGRNLKPLKQLLGAVWDSSMRGVTFKMADGYLMWRDAMHAQRRTVFWVPANAGGDPPGGAAENAAVAQSAGATGPGDDEQQRAAACDGGTRAPLVDISNAGGHGGPRRTPKRHQVCDILQDVRACVGPFKL